MMKDCPYCGRKLKGSYPRVGGGWRGYCKVHGTVDSKWTRKGDRA